MNLWKEGTVENKAWEDAETPEGCRGDQSNTLYKYE